MRRELEQLIKGINTEVMYYTETPVNLDGTWDECKYFLVWQNTHQIFKGFKTLAESVEFLKELIEEKIVWIDGRGFWVLRR